MLSLARFKWDIKSFKPDFCISATKGYIFPGMDVPFVVTICPSKLSCAIQCEGLQCFIEGSEPLQLTLAGCCMETPVSKEVTGTETGQVPPYPTICTTSLPGQELEESYRHRVTPACHPAWVSQRAEKTPGQGSQNL